MNKKGPVIVVEDDEDDQLILTEVFNNLKYTNEVIFFSDGEKALQFLKNPDVDPFFILSDINIPKLNGFALRDKLKSDADLSLKYIPCLFYSTAVSPQMATEAYHTSVQGLFIKQSSTEEIQNTISVIMEYWLKCVSPDSR